MLKGLEGSEGVSMRIPYLYGGRVHPLLILHKCGNMHSTLPSTGYHKAGAHWHYALTQPKVPSQERRIDTRDRLFLPNSGAFILGSASIITTALSPSAAWDCREMTRKTSLKPDDKNNGTGEIG